MQTHCSQGCSIDCIVTYLETSSPKVPNPKSLFYLDFTSKNKVHNAFEIF